MIAQTYLDRELALQLANAFEAGLLSDQEAEDFFQLLMLSGKNIKDIMPRYYQDVISLLYLRGNIKQLSVSLIANPMPLIFVP